jgi:hypothetical protein
VDRDGRLRHGSRAVTTDFHGASSRALVAFCGVLGGMPLAEGAAMRSASPSLILAASVLVGLLGCHTGLDLPAGASPCEGLDQTACQANAACDWDGCPDCSGVNQAPTCFTRTPEGLLCAPPSCNGDECVHHTDEVSCNADASCEPALCCGYFESCFSRQSTPPTDCDHSCPAVCAQHRDEASCNADLSCYSVFTVQPQTHSCTGPGCALGFDHCAMGSPICASPIVCTSELPQPNCDGPYSPDYDINGCYTDCVLSSACPEGE